MIEFGSSGDDDMRASDLVLKSEIYIKQEPLESNNENLCHENDGNYESARHQEQALEKCAKALRPVKPNDCKSVKIEVMNEEIFEALPEENDCDMKTELPYEYNGHDVMMKTHGDVTEEGNCIMKNEDNIYNNDFHIGELILVQELEEFNSPKEVDQKLNAGNRKENFVDIKEGFIREQKRNFQISEPSSSNSSKFGKVIHLNKNLKNTKYEKKEEKMEDLGSQQAIQNKKTFECSLCEYKANVRSNLSRHSLTHLKTKLLKCSECDYGCNRLSDLKLHLLKRHSNIKLVKCSECDYGCNRKVDLKLHLLNHHSNVKLFKCSECDFECNYKGTLKSHLLIHSNIKLFKCSECDYESNCKSTVQFHLLTHSNTKFFKCSECDFECKRKYSLKLHQLTHSDTKLFKCSECDYECNRKAYLKLHLLSHSDKKLLKCSECNYGCNRNDVLKKHMLTHSNAKLLACSECDYECKRKGQLKLHLRTHSNKNLFRCSELL